MEAMVIPNSEVKKKKTNTSFICSSNINLTGIGGQGGAVFFESTDSATLKKIWKNFPEKQIKADNGEDSNKARILGRRGSDIKVSF